MMAMNWIAILCGAAVIFTALTTKDHANQLALLIILFFGISLVMGGFKGRYSFDSTDNGSDRSGLRIYVDHKTGIQYLSTMTGLTVRRKEDGTPMRVTDDD